MSRPDSYVAHGRLALVAGLVAAMAVPGMGAAQSNGSGSGSGEGPTIGGTGNADYDPQELVKQFLPKSMLKQAQDLVMSVVADPKQWNQYIEPEPEDFRKVAGVYLGIYPRSYLAPSGQSPLQALGDPALWDILQQIGIEMMHPIASEQAGWLDGTELKSSVDGGFDRISMTIEPKLGTEEQMKNLVSVAQDHGAVIAGDVIPLHLGLGYDFRLAQMGYQDYAGAFDMIEVPEDKWGLLPDVSNPWAAEVITQDQAKPLLDAGIMPGTFGVLLGWPSSTNWSGWAATGPVKGVDGKTRRFIYAHLFKPSQPCLNWMDPTYNARIIEIGNSVHHVVDYGIKIDRLDAVPFLALNPQADSDEMTFFGLSLSIAGTEDLAYTHRKLGGFTWVELNVPAERYGEYLAHGPEMAYDFLTRAQTVHPLITGDARILSLAQRLVQQAKVDPRRLIHQLQNHDEIAYQLINLRSQDQVQYGGEKLSGSDLGDRILNEMQQGVAPPKAPYNSLYRPDKNGIATTYAGFIAPALGIDPYKATDDQVNTIKQAHLLLAAVTAMQPGVFALSQWDLVGALPIDRSAVEERIKNGDFRWLDRGAVDLMGTSQASETDFGLPKAKALYGSLPEQMKDPSSFARGIQRIVKARKAYQIAEAEVADVPDAQDNANYVLVMKLPDAVGGVAVTAANYGQKKTSVKVDLSKVAQGLSGNPHDIISDQDKGSLSGDQLSFDLDGLSAVTIVIGAQPASGSSGSGTGLTGGFGGTY